MFGREYANHPEILLSSFKQMNSEYKRLGKRGKKKLLQRIYLYIFGIPEIGFQLRSLYFSSIISKKLGNKKLNKILDAGSGIGVYTFWLAKKYSMATIIGGEIDYEKINFCKEYSKINRFQNVEFKKFDVTSPVKKGGEYNLIVNIDVLEHIEDYKNVLKNFHKLLGKGGYLYIHTPQPNQTRIIKSFKKWSHEDHLREGYTPEELAQTLRKLRFKIVSIRQTFGFFGKLAWELSHLSFKKGFVVAGIAYPITYLIALIDLLTTNKNGLGTAILAQKVK